MLLHELGWPYLPMGIPPAAYSDYWTTRFPETGNDTGAETGTEGESVTCPAPESGSEPGSTSQRPRHTRSRVVAEAQRLVVVNGYRRHVYEWPEVITVSLPRGAPWAVLDLADGTSQAVMGIQGSDGDRAIRAVRELRGLLRAG